MATKKSKSELDIEIPAGSKKLAIKSKLTPTLPEVVPTKETVKVVDDTFNKEILNQLELLNENIHKLYSVVYSSDWKLWKMMNMIEMIAKENGYSFSTSDEDTGPKEKETTK